METLKTNKLNNKGIEIGVEFIEEMFIQFKKENFRFLIYLHTECNILSKETYNIICFLFTEYLKKLYPQNQRYKVDTYNSFIRETVTKITVNQDNN